MDNTKRRILLHVTYKIREGLRDSFIKEVASAHIPEDTRLEPGNMKYSWSVPFAQKDQVFLFEIWENEEKQKAHLNTDNYKKLNRIKEKYVLSVDIEKFTVEEQ